MKRKMKFNLQKFADGADVGTAGGEGNAAGNNTGVAAPAGRKGSFANVVYGKQAEEQENTSDDGSKETTTENPKDRKAEFEKLIRGEYKEEFGERTQQIINKRFADTKALMEQQAAVQPILNAIAMKYGVDAGNIKALADAVNADNSLYEDEAAKRGIDVTQFRRMKTAEDQYQQLMNNIERAKAEERGREMYTNWTNQAEALKQELGLEAFDLEQELLNDDFANMLKAGVSVKGAYMANHYDEMMSGAMAAAASNVKKQVAKNVASRTETPPEGAASSSSGVVVKKDVKKLTKADRAEIARRAASGEEIRF